VAQAAKKGKLIKSPINLVDCDCNKSEAIPAFAGASVILTHFLGEAKMKKRKGFTLIELMVVILIVGILAAVAIPIMRGRIDSAKWSEGKAGAGSIRTAARAFCAEKGPDWGGTWANETIDDLGFNITAAAEAGDLDGKYFSDEAYDVTFAGYDTYTVTVTPGDSLSRSESPSSPSVITLDQAGTWVETP